MTGGRIIAVCISEKRGVQKSEVPSCVLVPGKGIQGDGHFGYGHRQVSALGDDSIGVMREKIPDLAHGAFGENFVTGGVDWPNMPLGARFRFGERAVLQIAQHGKECHSPCIIGKTVGECIMPRDGVFFSVRMGGAVKKGDGIFYEPDLNRVRYAVVTVSDRSSAGEREDRSGPVLCETVEGGLNAHRVAYEIVPDDRGKIAGLLKELSDNRVIDIIFTTGGTGLAPRDVTPEATCDVIDRQIPGMAEAMRMAGLAKTPHAMLSRAVCGQRGQTLIVNLSGSPKAVSEQLEALVPALPHAVAVASGIPQDCCKLRK